MTDSTSLVIRIEGSILLIRGQRVMLDADLAALYGVPTKGLNQALTRNRDRPDFVFQLTDEEHANLRSQFVTSSWGGRRTLPYAFTEQGVAMLSSVLRSKQAIAVNIEIMRAFVRLRHLLADNAGRRQRLDELERRYDAQFAGIFEGIRQLMKPADPPRRPLGYRLEDEAAEYEAQQA